MENKLGDIFETFVGSGKTDKKGREIGYTVGLRDDAVIFYAWVQNSRRIAGKVSEFGVAQRSRQFSSQQAATNWAYATAHERIAKL